jgi:CRP/FNR family transcriptional regulator, cyclic AMP receptor protein
MKKLSEFAALLNMNPLFAKLGEIPLERIAALCVRRKLNPGELLFEKGDQGDSLYGVRRGTIRIETGTEGGERLTLNVLGPGDLFGEIALLDGQARTANAVAAEDCELYVLRRHDFLAFIEREPQVAIRLIELLCQRLRWMNERMEEVALLPLHMRMARRLAGLALDFGSELRLTQGELSEFVGGARESVSRQLQKWRRAGIVGLRRGRIIILDGERLAAEASKGNKE